MDIPSHTVGTTLEYKFGPSSDYLLRAPWSTVDRAYDFTRSDGGHIRVPVPAGHKRVFVVPKGLMLEIPKTATAGSLLFFKHPDPSVSNWFTTRLPLNWQPKWRYLPVRLPKAGYRFELAPQKNCFEDLFQQVILLMQQMWEDFVQMCQDCCH